MSKKSKEYRSGYGQARADFLRELKKAINVVEDAITCYYDEGGQWGGFDTAPTLRGHLEGLKHARCLAKALKAEYGSDHG